jgi:hypothetical protein
MLELRAHNYASGLLQIGDSTSGSVVSANAERAPPASTREPTVSFFTGSNMIPRLCFEVEEMKESLHGFQYTLDYTTAFMKLCRKLGAGKQAKLILDRKNFYDSSCARQAPRIKELTDAGAMIKILKPEGSGFACMHAKTLIFDKKVVLTGSVNLTHNGLEHNKEHMLRITEPGTVADFLRDFEETWELATAVGPEELQSMQEKYDKKESKKKNSRSSQSGDASGDESECRGGRSTSSKSGRSVSRSVSKNASRSVSRSLSAELSPCKEESSLERKGVSSGLVEGKTQEQPAV